LFSSSQCTNWLPVYRRKENLPHWLCLPTQDILIEDIRAALDKATDCKTVYIATDKDYHELWLKLSREFPDIHFVTPSVSLQGRQVNPASAKPSLIIDTYLLTHSDYFIGNCMSSFTAFSGRLRIHGLNLTNTTTYFGLKELISGGKESATTPRTDL